ncbi:hypothetical protein [Dankookia sp. P2]|uniref:hypothetical protein n=1 Tax=Dankookia sp. P2 TaxID=3423955 RepID=UPI003D66CF31
MSEADLLRMLVAACGRAAAVVRPFSYSGGAGLWLNRDILPEPLSTLQKHRLEELGKKATDTGLLVKARAPSGQGAQTFLDVPNGPLAMGRLVAEFQGSRAEALADCLPHRET